MPVGRRAAALRFGIHALRVVAVEHRRCPHPPTRSKFIIGKMLTKCEIATQGAANKAVDLSLQIGERNLRWTEWDETKEEKKERRRAEKREEKEKKKMEELATTVLPPPPGFE